MVHESGKYYRQKGVNQQVQEQKVPRVEKELRLEIESGQ
jgi:hypothetical protein